MASMIRTGAPHFNSLAKQYRNANYNLFKVINECVDNVIKKDSCTEISIQISLNEDGFIHKIYISDNYYEGFSNLDRSGIDNPMNMGHSSDNHADDLETSEYGVGLKAGSVSISNQLDIYTKSMSLNQIFHITCDFNQMMQEEDVNQSYNPTFHLIDDMEYSRMHKFKSGSTIIMSNIRSNAYSKTTKKEITREVAKSLSITYGYFLDRVHLTVNDENVKAPHNYFEDPKCKAFTKTTYIIPITNDMNDIQYICLPTIGRPSIFNTKTKKYTSISKKELDEWLHEKGYKGLYSVIPGKEYPIEIKTTFTMYSDKSKEWIPMDSVNIYKDYRLYGSKALKANQRNGSHNYTLHHVYFHSKDIGKKLGITFNKEIIFDTMNNDLVNCIKIGLEDHRSEFSADTSTLSNKKLCEIALREGYITWDFEGLSSYHKEIKGTQKKDSGTDNVKGMLEEKKTKKKETIKKAEAPKQPDPPILVKKSEAPKVVEPIKSQKHTESPVEPLKKAESPKVIEPIKYQKHTESHVEPLKRAETPKQTEVVESIKKNEPPIIEAPKQTNAELNNSREQLREAARILLNIADDPNTTYMDGVSILNFIKSKFV
jgi:Histidine kinase-, DNA gyrase B-, and HSP90-like ATPase